MQLTVKGVFSTTLAVETIILISGQLAVNEWITLKLLIKIASSQTPPINHKALLSKTVFLTVSFFLVSSIEY
jgi:hypothetical protein